MNHVRFGRGKCLALGNLNSQALDGILVSRKERSRLEGLSLRTWGACSVCFRNSCQCSYGGRFRLEVLNSVGLDDHCWRGSIDHVILRRGRSRLESSSSERLNDTAGQECNVCFRMSVVEIP